jgi:tetratricopeptide (TPR) repeat protein
VIARPAIVVLALALAIPSPFRTEEPHVRHGNAQLRAGEAADALRLYSDAERASGAHAEIDFDRGHAALARGDLAAAVEAWRRAAERAPPALASRALQNVGTALAAAGDRDGAARALADALSRDPTNEDARWDLEVLLRQRAAAKPPPPGIAPVPASLGERRRDEASRDPADAPRAYERRAPISRQDAEALLDALRARERNAPFAPRRGREDDRRPDVAKDW